MNSWRPFANGIVGHTFEDFRKKFDKNTSSASKNQLQSKEPDPGNLSNFKVTERDLEMRLNSFKELKAKVEKQRDLIKKRDASFEIRKRVKESSRKSQLFEIREERMKIMRDIRKENEGRYGKHERYQSVGLMRPDTFKMTQISNDMSVRIPAIVSKNKINLNID